MGVRRPRRRRLYPRNRIFEPVVQKIGTIDHTWISEFFFTIVLTYILSIFQFENFSILWLVDTIRT